jgi:hypothetical protein
MLFSEYVARITELLSSDNEDELDFSPTRYPRDYGAYVLKENGRISPDCLCYSINEYVADANMRGGYCISDFSIASHLYKVGDIYDLIQFINDELDYYDLLDRCEFT